jgi:hypothetical protein
MKSFLLLLTLTTAISIPAFAQEPANPPRDPSPPANAPVEQQNTATSATKDNSGIGSDQDAKPSGAKGTTLIGCLSGPNAEGQYVLTSMQHRAGVQVSGPDDLKDDSGSKVKLTGSWEANPQQQPQTKTRAVRRFQTTAVEVLSQHCQVPAETTPVSREKQRQRQEQQQQTNSNTGDQTSPK